MNTLYKLQKLHILNINSIIYNVSRMFEMFVIWNINGRVSKCVTTRKAAVMLTRRIVPLEFKSHSD